MSQRDDAGASQVTFEPPDIASIVWVGNVDEAEMVRIVDASWALAGEPPDLFLLAHVSRMGSVTAQARLAAAEGVRRTNVRGCAILGASFATRVLITLTDKITSLIGPHDAPMRHFETEADARAWIAQRRAEVAAQRATSAA